MAVWQVSTQPGAEPLLLADVKNYLKIESGVTEDDDFITEQIKNARIFVERHLSRGLINQTITEYFDEFPTAERATKALDARIIKLHIAPVNSIDSITYIPTDGTPASYAGTFASSDYFLDNISGLNFTGPARICKKKGVDWPTIEPYTNAVKVIYTVGYGAAGTSVPGPILTAMRRLVGAWYYGRKGSFSDDWNAVKDLLDPYKVHR